MITKKRQKTGKGRGRKGIESKMGKFLLTAGTEIEIGTMTSVAVDGE